MYPAAFYYAGSIFICRRVVSLVFTIWRKIMARTHLYRHKNSQRDGVHETAGVVSSQEWAGCPGRSPGCPMHQWATARALDERMSADGDISGRGTVELERKGQHERRDSR